MSTKKEQASQIYRELVERGHTDRNLIVQRFQHDLDMTAAGAATYYAACKREFFGTPSRSKPVVTNNHNTTTTPAVNTNEKGSDTRTLYTVCTIVDDVVDSSNSYFDKQDALQAAGTKDLVVRGVPDIGTACNKLKTIS